MTTNTRPWIQDLPKVPVPDLHDTLERYLSGLKPVIPVAQFEQTKRTVDHFLEPNGEGERLQAILRQYAQQTDNWVTPFWLDDMYLLNPIALPINSNPFYLFPRQQFKTSTDQLRLAVQIIQFAYDFKTRIEGESLEQDFGSGHGRGQPLCMQTYKHFFAAYRVPGEEKDQLLIVDHNQSESEHIVIACRNQFFVIEFKKNCLPNEDSLLDKLKHIWYLSKEYESSAPLLGILTTDNRKIWANNRKKLLSSDQNKYSLKMMETCLFVVCLDDCVSTKANRTQRRDSIQMARMDSTYMASMLLHGGGSQLYTSNRWFDKFFQVIIGKDGIFGILCEHSASEGMTVLRFCEEFIDYLEKQPNSSWLRKDSTKGRPYTLQNSESVSGVIPLRWHIEPGIKTSMLDSAKRIDRLISDLDLYVLQFNEFGKQSIKELKLSPDAFVQLALQLTYYKVHRKLVSTYESASIRQFRLGRVDNIRAATLEALSWAKAMCDEIPEITEKHKSDMFRKAIDKQMEILKYTISGYGIDNHLLGLKEISKMEFQEIPVLFKEKSYKEFLNFRLSTSQLASEKGVLVGYGPVVPDGYGVAYNVCNQSITFCISSFFSSSETSSDFFALSLEGSLLQMKELCNKQNSISN